VRKPKLRLAALVLSLILLSAVNAHAEAARKIEVRESGLVANLWFPEGEGPFPGLLLLGGSGGGIGWQDEIVELLVGHGFVALALAYFGLEGLPDELERIPLEFVDRGRDRMIAFLERHLKPSSGAATELPRSE
jgi:dienelactone hydrolase